MRGSPRQPAALIALLLVLVLAAGLWLGGHPTHLPGFLRSVFVSGQKTRAVDEAIERIASTYYRPVSTSQIANSSIAGAVTSLHDRFSHYLTPAEFHEFNSPPHFTGIGVAVGPERRGLLIARVFDSSPAARAGLKPGDLIVNVNGRRLEGLSPDSAIALIKGLPGTDVALRVESPSRGGKARQVRTLKITRATISEPVVASATKTVHGKRLGVVVLATFSPGAHGEVRDAVQHELRAGARGLVLDLRGNGGGLLEEAQLVASV